MSIDPTEPFRQVELMQAVYHTPYEAFSPYDEGMPPCTTCAAETTP
ncbi:MAG: hypothetical protein ACXVDN_11395 [Ktedonobacteraceae bacterium]